MPHLLHVEPQAPLRSRCDSVLRRTPRVIGMQSRSLAMHTYSAVDAPNVPASRLQPARSDAFPTCVCVCAGPVSRLLDHLRMQEPTADTRGAVGQPQAAPGCASAAAAMSSGVSGTDLARRTAAQLSLQSRAEAQAAEDGNCVFVHGPGGTMHEHKGAGAGGGKAIAVAGLGLKELPAEVFEVGASAAMVAPLVR